MTDAELLARVRKVFDSVFLLAAPVEPSTTAADVEDWDSLRHVTLIACLEEEFGARFAVGELSDTRSVGDLVAALRRAGAR